MTRIDTDRDSHRSEKDRYQDYDKREDERRKDNDGQTKERRQQDRDRDEGQQRRERDRQRDREKAQQIEDSYISKRRTQDEESRRDDSSRNRERRQHVEDSHTRGRNLQDEENRASRGVKHKLDVCVAFPVGRKSPRNEVQTHIISEEDLLGSMEVGSGIVLTAKAPPRSIEPPGTGTFPIESPAPTASGSSSARQSEQDRPIWSMASSSSADAGQGSDLDLSTIQILDEVQDPRNLPAYPKEWWAHSGNRWRFRLNLYNLTFREIEQNDWTRLGVEFYRFNYKNRKMDQYGNNNEDEVAMQFLLNGEKLCFLYCSQENNEGTWYWLLVGNANWGKNAQSKKIWQICNTISGSFIRSRIRGAPLSDPPKWKKSAYRIIQHGVPSNPAELGDLAEEIKRLSLPTEEKQRKRRMSEISEEFQEKVKELLQQARGQQPSQPSGSVAAPPKYAGPHPSCSGAMRRVVTVKSTGEDQRTPIQPQQGSELPRKVILMEEQKVAQKSLPQTSQNPESQVPKPSGPVATIPPKTWAAVVHGTVPKSTPQKTAHPQREVILRPAPENIQHQVPHPQKEVVPKAAPKGGFQKNVQSQREISLSSEPKSSPRPIAQRQEQPVDTLGTVAPETSPEGTSKPQPTRIGQSSGLPKVAQGLPTAVAGGGRMVTQAKEISIKKKELLFITKPQWEERIKNDANSLIDKGVRIVQEGAQNQRQCQNKGNLRPLNGYYWDGVTNLGDPNFGHPICGAFKNFEEYSDNLYRSFGVANEETNAKACCDAISPEKALQCRANPRPEWRYEDGQQKDYQTVTNLYHCHFCECYQDHSRWKYNAKSGGLKSGHEKLTT